MFLQMGFVPKDKDGYLSRILSVYEQLVGIQVHQVVPLLGHLAMLEYFPKKELKNFFSVESLGELDIAVESKYCALIEDLSPIVRVATTQEKQQTGNWDLHLSWQKNIGIFP